MTTAIPARRHDTPRSWPDASDAGTPEPGPGHDPGSGPAGRLIISCAHLHSAHGPGCPHCPPRRAARLPKEQ
jgi:hypothetical protein